jgi:hypothetical protein
VIHAHAGRAQGIALLGSDHRAWRSTGVISERRRPFHRRPDAGQRQARSWSLGRATISFTTLFERRADELYYERYIYGADGVMNYVYCTFDPTYEAYFYAIVQRMGRSMRAISGGQPERVDRVSEPFTVD